MQRFICLALAFLIGFHNPAKSSQQLSQNVEKKINRDPEAAQLITSDIDHFWKTYDATKPDYCVAKPDYCVGIFKSDQIIALEYDHIGDQKRQGISINDRPDTLSPQAQELLTALQHALESAKSDSRDAINQTGVSVANSCPGDCRTPPVCRPGH